VISVWNERTIILSCDYEAIVKLSDGFNGADMRNVCTEAGMNHLHIEIVRGYIAVVYTSNWLGMFAIRAERDYVQEDDFSKAVRKVAESKKLESKFDYKAQGST
jgi:26S proteasome regulatory subunit T4